MPVRERTPRIRAADNIFEGFVQAVPGGVLRRALRMVAAALADVPEELRPLRGLGPRHLLAGPEAALCALPADSSAVVVSGDGLLCPKAERDAEGCECHNLPLVRP